MTKRRVLMFNITTNLWCLIQFLLSYRTASTTTHLIVHFCGFKSYNGGLPRSLNVVGDTGAAQVERL